MPRDLPGGSAARGKVVSRGVRYGTVRRKCAPRPGTWTGLGFVRQPLRAAEGRVVLNFWEIRLEDHSPSPFRTVAWTQEAEWVPVAVTGHVPSPKEVPCPTSRTSAPPPESCSKPSG